MGMIYGIIGMGCLIAGYWADQSYTYGDGRWLIAASMAPGIIVGLWSAMAVEFTELPELVGAYNGFGGLAAALEGIGLYLDPNAVNFVRGGEVIVRQTNAMLWVQAIALILSIVIGMMTFTGSMVAVSEVDDRFWFFSLGFLFVLNPSAFLFHHFPGSEASWKYSI